MLLKRTPTYGLKRRKIMSKFVKGKSGNPNGRPKGKGNVTSNRIKTDLKNVMPEALENLVEYMRECGKEVKAQKKLITSLTEELIHADPEDMKGLAKQLKVAVEMKMLSADRQSKASIKLVDMSYAVVKEDDKIEISKRKIPKTETELELDKKVATLIAPSIDLSFEDKNK